MKLRPTIFLSGVSSEFASFRDAVENEIQMKGCFAENQPGFHPDYRTVEAMLRSRLQEANAVIHIVGFRFGAESKDRPPDKPRRSYTQMEFDIAREMEKPIYIFLSEDPNVRDALSPDEKPEDAEVTALQLAHRDAIKSTNYIWYSFKDKNDLCRLVGLTPLVEADFRVDISRIDMYAPAELIGREDELKLLDDTWLKVRRAESRRPHILTFVALGGEGKTSLVAKWAAGLAYENWPGCDSAFAWSFYSQGTRDQLAASSDLFLKEALTFFGNEADREFAASNVGAYEKGQHLARIVGQRRALLILDGLEPLQYAPTSVTPGALKDAGLTALLKGLAADNDGLCIITTRYSLPNLRAFWQTTAPEVRLLRLSNAAGVHLLKTLGVNGSPREFETLVEDLKGHALTLNLIGAYLRDAHGGDIRRRDLVKLEEADVAERGGEAFRVIEAYARAFENEGNNGQRALSLLRLLGLFDRPMSVDSITALRQLPAITDLTEPLVSLSEAQLNLIFKRLEDAQLVSTNREPSGALVSLDTHPLLREYFARQMRTLQPEAWIAGHRRLYEHLCDITPDKTQPTLDDLQPLYQAVAHGCQAGLHQEAFDDVFIARIHRGNESYSTTKLGAFHRELRAIAWFFEQPWSRVSSGLDASAQALLLNEAAVCLQFLGWLPNAQEPMRAALQMHIQSESWKGAAISAANLSELYLISGHVAEAIVSAEQSVTFADRSNDAFLKANCRATQASTLHQAGRSVESEMLFLEAELIQEQMPSAYQGLSGVKYLELMLAPTEREAWAVTMSGGWKETNKELLKTIWSTTYERAIELRRLSREGNGTSLLVDGLNELAVGQAVLHEAILEGGSFAQTHSSVDRSLSLLRRAGQMQYLVCGLLTRSWLRFLDGAQTGPESAQTDLDEAWEIAERGPMRLLMAEILLYRVRLFGLSEWETETEKQWSAYPWTTVETDLISAEKLIQDTGYWRRQVELRDAKTFLVTSNLRIANKHEESARKLVALGDLSGAWVKFLDAIGVDESRKTRIEKEFAFAFSFEELDPANPRIKPITEALEWKRQVWSVLAKGSGVQFEQTVRLVSGDSITPDEDRKAAPATANTSAQATPGEKGDLLEQAVSRLFKTFFRMEDHRFLRKNRSQQRGTQHGYDLSVEWTGEVASSQPMRVHIECKNYSGAISHNEVGGKLIMEGTVYPPIIEHWILISPNTNPTNELNRFLESEQRNPKYPFDIQIWCPETDVHEFFGLEPEVFDLFYSTSPGIDHPRTWSAEKCDEIRKKWMAKLAPPMRLPAGWAEYIRQPAKLCTPGEDTDKFDEIHTNHVPLRCRNFAGALLEKPLMVYIEEWLNQADKPTLLLLGEFGDGKTYFTYVLARYLAKSFIENGKRKWLPLRLSLKRFAGNAREFLRQRLEEFKADVAGWLEMSKTSERLVILDGFDEMSVKVGPAAVTKNIADLLECVREFKDCKVLITSRTHFFENRQDARRLIVRLDNPTVYQLAPIGRKEALRSTEKHLALTVGLEQARETLSRIDQMNDPIGLAGKPLFLEMLKVVLSNPNLPVDLNMYDLYESYIDQSLERNDNRLDDGDYRADPEETIPNMRKILGALAEQLQRSGNSYVSLNQFQTKAEKPIAMLLWRLTGGEEMEEDALRRVGARSLLTRVSIEGSENEWLVDFCHRSMREYFVAIRLTEAVEADVETGRTFLKEVPLNYEILQFACERWRMRGVTSLASDRLLRLIDEASHMNAPGSLGGNALTLLYRLNPSLPRARNWKGKVFDGADLEDADLSDMDFTDSSFVGANLANVNLESAIFKDCDLRGVRLEETKSVVSLAANPSGEELIALYGDGVMRKWQVKSGSKMSSNVVSSRRAEFGSVVGIHETGQAWLRTPREWSFLDQNAEEWSIESGFPIIEGYECIQAKAGRLAFSKKLKEDLVELRLVDLRSNKIVGSKEVNPSVWCAALGDEAFIWSDASLGFQVSPLGSRATTGEVVLDMPSEPTCLDIWRCDTGEYIVASGTGDGRVYAWKLQLKAGSCGSLKLLETQAHQGAVTAVAFTNESRIASGGSDRTIVLTRLLGVENLSGLRERKLQRSLRCRGMRIEGVKGPNEFELLRAFVSQCEEDAKLVQ